jgi:hypothetical protein
LAEAREHAARELGLVGCAQSAEQRLLEKFPILVSDHGVDRRQGCFAAALLTVRLRAGDVDLFVPAADAANVYITTNWEKA